MNSTEWSVMPEGCSLADRVECMSPHLNKMMDAYEEGEVKVGVFAFQEHVLTVLEKAKLSEKRRIQVDNVGVHPQNREGVGLVPIDVHDLLLAIASAGWSWSECREALAGEIPPNDNGHAWRIFNENLAEKSDGLLAKVNPDLLEVCTARGSHTTAGVRCMKLGSRGIHPQLCDSFGQISKAKIVDMQPSMQAPIDNGMLYTVVRWQIIESCPKLMDILSRTGNASHGIARTQTVLQGCKRMLALYNTHGCGKDDPWEHVAKLASVGMPQGYINMAGAMCSFVKEWSGGKGGRVLDELEAFERTLKVKRNISSQDLRCMGCLKFPEAPRYVPAMFKAALAAPAAFVNDGVSTLFTASDFQSVQIGGRNRSAAIKANDLMIAAHTFMAAYATTSETATIKILANLEIRMVMFVHGKRSGSRVQHDSLMHIASQMYKEASAAMDRELPTWSILKGFVDKTEAASASSKGSSDLREFASTTVVTDNALRDKGIVIGAVVSLARAPASKYTVEDIGEEVVTIKSVQGDNTVRVHRALILDAYSKDNDAEVVVYDPTDLPGPETMLDLNLRSIKGVIEHALMVSFKASAEEFVQIHRKPTQGVTALKAFKPGQLQLIPMSTNIAICKTFHPKQFPEAVKIPKVYTHCNGDEYAAVVKATLQWPSATTDKAAVFSFWAIRSTQIDSEANVELTERAMGVSVVLDRSKDHLTFMVPVLTNTVELTKGSELLYMRSIKPTPSIVQPKRACPAEAVEPAHAKKGKKGKGKGKDNKE